MDVTVELGFYRKYTEAMVRRYMRLSHLEGRGPTLVGREVFRGRVSELPAPSLEDSIAYCVDIERCVSSLSADHRQLVQRITLQQYTLSEAAALLGYTASEALRRYAAALDCLTQCFFDRGLLSPLLREAA